MGETTNISWTDHTFNAWWGCENVSPGCDHCYAEAFSKRTGHDVWGHNAPHRFFGDKHWAEPLKWDRRAEEEGRQHRVFACSMADVFQNSDDLVAERQRFFELIEATPHLTWQLLTKRPENVNRMIPDSWLIDGFPYNVWLGTTVEDQTRLNLRVPRLLDVEGVRVRFLSCEPLLETVTFRWAKWVPFGGHTWHLDGLNGIHWIITGGESGPGHRPFNPEWARRIRDEADEAGVAFFFKQHGGRTPTAGGCLLDGRERKEFPG